MELLLRRSSHLVWDRRPVPPILRLVAGSRAGLPEPKPPDHGLPPLPGLIATLASLVLPPELLSLLRRQDLSHCQQHRHPRLAEVAARLLEQVDLGHDSLVVVPIVGEEGLEVGLLILDVRFEVGEPLLIPGEDLLETPHLVLGQLQFTANVPPLPELAVVPSQRARPVRSGLDGRAWHHEDAG